MGIDSEDYASIRFFWIRKLSFLVIHSFQIKICYTDDTEWTSGHDGGMTEERAVVMTTGEWLVKVVHEKFYNNTCAAAAVEFETNKGRKYQ